MKYKILTRLTGSELESEVNELLKMGWQLHGGVCITAVNQIGNNIVKFYCQAMTLEDQDQK